MVIRPVVLILLLIIAAPALASATPDTVSVQSDTEWLIAGSAAYATITATVSNGSSPLPDIPVTFSLDDPAMGTLSAASTSTNNLGKATVRFTPSTRSGNAGIRVSAGHDPVEATFDQKIDHCVPKTIANLTYPHEATVGSTVLLSLTLHDQYGNPVDNRRETALSLPPEYVTMTVSSPEGNARFFDGSESSVTASIPVDTQGFVNTSLQLEKKPVDHVILIDPSPPQIPSRWITITAIADGIPHSVDRHPSTSALYAPADGASKIDLFYTFYDEYGNRAGKREIQFTATTVTGTTTASYSTSSAGEIRISYGPVITLGEVTITCTAVDNEAVHDTVALHFYHTTPVAMLLTANPLVIPSADLDSGITADIRAKVIDARGNPVPGESVHFSLQSVDIGDYTTTSDALLDGTEGVTNEDGLAIVKFSPSGFTTDPDHPGYSKNATGSAVIAAVWNGEEKTVSVSWKNYPFLSISTMVEPETVAVNETINVTVKIVGDGWALQPDPVDVVLVIDTSGSMTKTDVSPNRMAAARKSAKEFVSQMDLESGRDRVAVASFSSTATLLLPLTNDPDAVNAAIDGLAANGATIMRRGYYEGIRHLKEEGRPGAVKAVILMGDGDWNLHGSPLATGIGYPDTASDQSVRYQSYETTYGIALSAYPWSGSTYDFSNEGYEWYSDLPEPKGVCDVIMSWRRYWPVNTSSNGVLIQGSVSLDGQHTNQNMSVYAMSGTPDKQVRVYTIGFAETLDSRVEQDITILSEATGGSYLWAGDEEDLTAVYTQIAGELITEAGVNTKLHLSHEFVLINNEMMIGGGPDGAFTYIPKTMIRSWRNDKVIIPEYFVDQSEEWHGSPAPAYSLLFDVGTIQLNQVWEVRYSLMARKGGNINIYNSNSMVTFENAPDEGLGIPTTYLTVIPSMEVAGLQNHPLKIFNLRPTAPGHISTTLPVAWDLEYSGSGEVTQQIWYTIVDPMIHATFGFNGPYQWQLAGTQDGSARSITLGVAGKNGICLIRVDASAPGSPDDRAEIAIPIGSASGQAYIKIE